MKLDISQQSPDTYSMVHVNKTPSKSFYIIRAMYITS